MDIFFFPLLLILSFLTLIPLLITRRKDLFEPIYWASAVFFLHFCVRSFYSYFRGSRFLGVAPFDYETMHAWTIGLLYLIVSFIVFLLGYYSRLGVALSNTIPALPKEWNFRRAKRAVFVCVFVGLVAFLLLAGHFGGWLQYLMQKQLTRTASGTVFLEQFKVFFFYGLFISVIMCLRRQRGLVVTGILFVIALFIAASSGSRGQLIFLILSMVVIGYYLTRKVPWKYAALFCALLLLMPLYDLYAHATNRESIVQAFGRVLSLEAIIGSFKHAPVNIIQRAYGMDSLVLIIRDTPLIVDYQLGKTIAPLLIAWIPRAIWPSKPITSVGRWYAQTYFAQWYGGSETAAAATILGDAYSNFHIGGVLWVALISGIVLRFLYHYLIVRGGLSGIFVYGSVFPSVFMFWENSIVGAVMSYVPPLVLTVAILWFIRIRRKNTFSGSDILGREPSE